MSVPWERVERGLQSWLARHAILPSRPLELLKQDSESVCLSLPFVKTMSEGGTHLMTLGTLTLV